MNPAQNFDMPVIDWTLLSQFIVVSMTGVLALIIEMLRPKKSNVAIIAVTLIGLVAAFAMVVGQLNMAPARTLNGFALRDQFGLAMQAIMIGGTILCCFFSEPYLRHKRIAFGEFYPLATWALFGGMLMVSADNLMMQFIGLEVLSVALYTLAGLSRNEAKSEEAALKYFLLGALASAFFLYGAAFAFGASGSTSLESLHRAFMEGAPNIQIMAMVGLGFILVGLGFKSALVPFHQWTPDVYQGSPTNVTAFMAVVSKVAAIGALGRVLFAAGPVYAQWAPAMTVIAILTMTVGNLVALAQRDVKRVLAYSSIAHAGYLLVALMAHAKMPNEIGFQTVIFYLLNYAVMTIGGFAVLTLNAKGGKDGSRFSDVAGLWKKSPLAAGSLVIFMASLVGVPPTGGFFSKLQIFMDALHADLLPLAIILAVNSAISAYYYLAIARAVFVDDEPVIHAEKAPMNLGLAVTCVLCVLGVLGVSAIGQPILDATRNAGQPQDVAPHSSTLAAGQPILTKTR